MDERAVVLKYLELRASTEQRAVDELFAKSQQVTARARMERDRGNRLLAKLGGTVIDAGAPTLTLPVVTHGPVLRWSELREEAAAALFAEGIQPSTVTLPRSAHELDIADVVAALSFGAIGAIIPSLGSRRGSVQDAFHGIQQAADTERLPRLLQRVFGRHPAPFMDTGASGMYHRFCDGHDLLTALPAGVAKLGWVSGPLQVFQHLLTDSFGSTGIPLPGTDLIGQAVARVASVSSITDLISPKDLSRYASLRMSDAVASSVTGFLLWLYSLARGIPENSMRRPKLGVLAHGLCLVGVAAFAATPGLAHMVPFRSHLNYVSLVAMSKHAWSWRSLTRSLAIQNDAGLEHIRAGTLELEAFGTELAPARMHDEFQAAASMLAAEVEDA
jgi:hypothetical protein